MFAASIPLSILVTLPIALAGADPDAPTVTLVAVLLTGAIWLGLVGSTVVGPGALSWREIAPGLIGVAPGRIAADVAAGVAWAVPVILVTAVLGAVLIGIFGAAPEPPIRVPRDGVGLILSLIAAAVVAPISEELFYRGFATTAWARSYGQTRGIVEGALFFAFVHVLTLSGPDFGSAGRAALVAFLARSRWRWPSAGCSSGTTRCRRRSGSTPRSTGSSCCSPSGQLGRRELTHRRAAGQLVPFADHRRADRARSSTNAR